MIPALPRVGDDAGQAPCYKNAEFYEVRTAVKGQRLVDRFCAQCRFVSDCKLLAVATKERFGVLYGVWAGQVYTPDGSDRT